MLVSKAVPGVDRSPAGIAIAIARNIDLHASEGGSMYQRILVGVNNTVGSRAALKQALEYAAPFGARTVAVFAEAPFWTPRPMDRYAFESAMRLYAQSLSRQFQLPVEFRVRYGFPAHTLAEQAHLLGCDLIVLGHASDAALHRWLTSSISQRVRRQAPCPVLVVRSNQELGNAAVLVQGS